MKLDYADIEPQLRGLWHDIMASYGIKVPPIKGRNTDNHPCPLCGGDDRAHWRDEGGRIALYCRVCAHVMKSPETVIMEYTGIEFYEFVKDMADFINHVPIDRIIKAQKVIALPKINLPPDHRVDQERSEKFLSKCNHEISNGITFHQKGDYEYLSVQNAVGDIINVVRLANPMAFIAGGISYGGFSLIRKGATKEILCVSDFVVAWELVKVVNNTIAICHSDHNLKYVCLFGLSGELDMKPVLSEFDDDYLAYEMDHYRFNTETKQLEKIGRMDV